VDVAVARASARRQKTQIVRAPRQGLGRKKQKKTKKKQKKTKKNNRFVDE
jgi:hypothetical protein